MNESNLYAIWLIGGFVLMILELLLPGGIVFFLGLGAVLVGALLHLEAIHGILESCTTWFIGSLALLFGFRGVVQRLIPAKVDKGSTDEDLDAYNKEAVVSERIPSDGEGRIEFRGTTWKARNYHRAQELEKGSKVRVIFRDNLAWLVEAEDFKIQHDKEKRC